MSQHAAFAIARRSRFRNPLNSGKRMLGSPESSSCRVASRKEATGSNVSSVLRSSLVWCALVLGIWIGAGILAQAQFPATNVGSTSVALPITVTVSAAATTSEASAQVLTMGISGLDFQTSDTSPCNGKSAGQSCTLSVTFTPKAPGVRMGAVKLLDAGNAVLGTAFISGIGQGGLGALRPTNIGSTAFVQIVAGTGGYLDPVIDPGPALNAELYFPSSVVCDGAGNLYISDSLHNLIRKVTFAGGVGTISTIAGDGTAGYVGGDDIPASTAEVRFPGGLALDGAGNLYIADTGNNVIRMISASTGIITRVAGIGGHGFTGDGGPATAARLNNPEGVAVDANGNLWIADTDNNAIRKVSAATRNISTVAGTGAGGYSGNGGLATSAQLDGPYAVAFGNAGNWYIADAGNNVVRKVDSSNIITTVAGNGNGGITGDGGLATSADLNSPSGLAVDPAGNIYIAARSGNKDSEIRKVSASTGKITTLALNTTSLYQPVQLDGPIGLSIDGNGNLFFADSLDMQVKEIPSNFAVLDFTLQGAIRQGSLSAALTQTVENIGNAALDITGYTLPDSTALPVTPPVLQFPLKNLVVNDAKSTCTSVGANLAVNASCTYVVTFAPGTLPQLSKNSVLLSDVDVTDTAIASVAGANSPLIIRTYGTAAPLNSTTTTLPASPMTATFGTTSPLIATVTTGLNTGLLNGTVTFTDTYKGVDTVTSEPVGQVVTTTVLKETAALPISTLQVGLHSVVACYVPKPGDTHSGSCSSPDANGNATPLLLTINENTTTKVTSAPASPSALGTAVVFTATVSVPANSGQDPDSTVNFTTTVNNVTTALCNNVALSPGTVANTWTATCAPPASALVQGANLITANYLADASLLVNPSSGSMTQNVQVPSVVTLKSAPNPSNYGSPVTFTFAAAGTPAATGKVTFSYAAAGGTVTLGSSSAPTNGSWTFTTPANAPLPVGTIPITATYSGDASWAQATATLNQVVNPALTTIAFVNPPATAEVEMPVSFTVQVSSNGTTPTGNVVFFDGATQIGSPVALNASGTATLTYTFTTTSATAPHSITATYAGDANNAPPVVPITPDVINVTAIPTQTSLVQATTNGANSVPILIATVVGVDLPVQFPPTGTVVFTNGAATLGSAQLVNGVATFQPNATGVLNVIATYSPNLAPVDPLHLGSASSPLSVTNNANGFTLAATPPKLTISPTQNASVTLTITPVNGFKDTVGLGCASLPPGMTCTFSSLTVALDGANAKTITLTIDTNNPLLGGATATNTPRGNARFALASILWPFGLLSGFVLWHFRKCAALVRNALLILVFAVTAALVNGCGGIGKSSAVPGTYAIQVVGVGINSNISQYVPLTVVVTK